MLSWIFTVQKAQLLSLSKDVVRFDLEKQNSFNHEQMCVVIIEL